MHRKRNPRIIYCLSSKSNRQVEGYTHVWYDQEKQVAKIHSPMSKIGYGDYYRYEWLKDIEAEEGEDVKPGSR